MLSHNDVVSIARLENPDLTIAPDGKPYLYRWHLIPRNDKANVYFHIQVDSDPERPLHDHPWDNTSVILSGGYDELWQPKPFFSGLPALREIRARDVIHRKAEEAHRLILPKKFLYTMTIFSTGPRVRPWGFWFSDGWLDAHDVLEDVDGMSVMTDKARGDAKAQ